MKKSLFALAALGAFATAAQAQSTVTLYGTLDTSVAYLTGLQATTSTGITNASNSITTGDGLSYIDGSFATSSWGMRGSEDLGGGMKANFHLESDINTANATSDHRGLWRRAANVSLADAKMGEVFLGRRGNAYIIATAQMLPVSGNTAHQWRTVGQTSVGDQISNSVTYATPTIMATNVVVQYGMNNTVNNGDDGTMTAAHLVNKSIKGLTILGAYNNMRAANNATSQLSAANSAATNREGYAAGLKYQVTPAIEVGSFYAHGRQNSALAAAAATTFSTTGLTGVGVGYQAAPNLLLGANYVKTTFQAQMTNLQAHYMLSKRTRIYSQITLTQAAKGNIQSGNLAANGFSPIASNGTTTLLVNQAIPASAGSQNVPTNANGYNIGIIHTF